MSSSSHFAAIAYSWPSKACNKTRTNGVDGLHEDNRHLRSLAFRNAAQLRNKISLTPIGERLQLTLRRKGVVSEVSVEVAPASQKATPGRARRVTGLASLIPRATVRHAELRAARYKPA